METNPIEKERYTRAAKRVKRIRGFYTHALVYIVINILIVTINIQNLAPNESYFQWHNFITLIGWGVGLLAHGLSVFAPNIILGKDWEERKIKELMNNDKKP
ncbi:2TM domain-containing protein [Flaviramulus basaltis]|uniref:2TM domain-containing protein n=1 Tax=Flaviramulus basaltis TaxID=369401 RepID=A0A1K2IJP7_9FLAO|nr:2TM domain-containing protein [Flaviramulus basaltis]SFZ92615.1 2TM domain-containing protein [Flaviramulus basaltis]